MKMEKFKYEERNGKNDKIYKKSLMKTIHFLGVLNRLLSVINSAICHIYLTCHDHLKARIQGD
ncbi:hypothetical protein VY86_21045 [Photorhabdus thracensis]|uniref:Uncharacterized protein n=1 Tax=Photorhabdus thracensis TaxID=230089 RepID=A0A0F7LU61_9GAMM|nr:hypothetical protein VY86_21045 [Photorhabdus thracensis]